MEIPESKAKGLGNYQRTPNPQPDRRSIWPSSRPSQPLEEEIVEDAKGVQTTDFVIKKKLMKAIYNINIKISKKK